MNPSRPIFFALLALAFVALGSVGACGTVDYPEPGPDGAVWHAETSLPGQDFTVDQGAPWPQPDVSAPFDTYVPPPPDTYVPPVPDTYGSSKDISYID